MLGEKCGMELGGVGGGYMHGVNNTNETPLIRGETIFSQAVNIASTARSI